MLKRDKLEAMLRKISDKQFDAVWRGEYCGKCQRKKFCADYRELLGKA